MSENAALHRSTLLAVALGSGVGGLVRWATGLAFDPAAWLLPTVIVNLLGCLLIGVAGAWLVGSGRGYHPAVGAGVVAGFCGSLTTFSGHVDDLVRLSDEFGPASIAVLLAAMLVGWMLATWLGFRLVHIYFRFHFKNNL